MNGLIKNVAAAGRRWTASPGGDRHAAAVLSAVGRIRARVAGAHARRDEAAAATCIAEVRAVLEWTTYQSRALDAARALGVARRTRSLAVGLGLLDDDAAPLHDLLEAEHPLLERVRSAQAAMTAVAQRHPELGLPPPLVRAESLASRPARAGGRLGLLRLLRGR